MNIEQLQQLIDNELNELRALSSDLSKIEKYSHQTSLMTDLGSFVFGTIGPALVGATEDHRLMKYLQKEIYKGMTYGQISSVIIEHCKKLVDWQKQIQSLCDNTNSKYYGNVGLIESEVENCADRWYQISPDVADAKLKAQNGQLFTLGDLVVFELKQSLNLLDHPVQSNKTGKGGNSNSGCGCIIITIIMLTSLVATACSLF